MQGRIYFPGNPWPAGHALEALVWSGRVDGARGLVFDLHLQTAKYYAEGEGLEGDSDSDFRSPIVWSNYHSCSLSSTKWDSNGWGVGTPEAPFAFSSLAGRVLVADTLDSPELDVNDVNERAFHIYLLGHDDVVEHRFLFQPVGEHWNLEWKGWIALAYAGDYAFRYGFRAEATGLEFSGFRVDDALSDDEAHALFARCCDEAAAFKLTLRDGKRWFVPNEATTA
uniref:Uncharacterized protein n=1 Tax=uncultured bacterium A1Q1_fos_91 TaxID=1256591 RepID=L7VWP0_9BACT|nr:hypothetical protein [uncultured bacterium A1Q1_fos_91]